MTTKDREKTEEKERARDQARMQLESIVGMLKALEDAREANEFAIYEGEEVTADDMEQRIQEDPLSIQVRSDWHTLGDEDFSKPAEYEILLCTGGPAVRIVGDLSGYQEPDTAKIEYQDWFTPWEALLPLEEEEHEALLSYARQFYFAE